MARLQPFSAFRYDLGRVQAADVLTQPYDKISPELRLRYLERSPFNLVRVILGDKHERDSDADNVYTRARGYLDTWMRDGLVRRDSEPGVYPCVQRFQVPGTGETRTRSGFIALGAIEEYSRRVVFRHEQTLSGPKLDRQLLLRATRTHVGQIFMLYSDPARTVEAELLQRAVNPILECVDDYGVDHKLYRETDAGVMDRLQRALADRALIIADGHHRYETALQWRDEQRALAPHRADAPWDWVMMTFVNLDAPGLVVLPTHRVVHSLPDFNPAAILARLGTWFEAAPVAGAGDWDALRRALAESTAQGRIALGVALAGRPGLQRLRLKPDVDLAAELPRALPEQRRLDVLLLHELALQRALGITAEAVREQRNVRYVRDPLEALASVRDGEAQAVFFLNPIAPQQVRDVALAGGVMPQKSTDFYPKMLSGLTMYRVD